MSAYEHQDLVVGVLLPTLLKRAIDFHDGLRHYTLAEARALRLANLPVLLNHTDEMSNAQERDAARRVTNPADYRIGRVLSSVVRVRDTKKVVLLAIECVRSPQAVFACNALGEGHYRGLSLGNTYRSVRSADAQRQLYARKTAFEVSVCREGWRLGSVVEHFFPCAATLARWTDDQVRAFARTYEYARPQQQESVTSEYKEALLRAIQERRVRVLRHDHLDRPEHIVPMSATDTTTAAAADTAAAIDQRASMDATAAAAAVESGEGEQSTAVPSTAVPSTSNNDDAGGASETVAAAPDTAMDEDTVASGVVVSKLPEDRASQLTKDVLNRLRESERKRAELAKIEQERSAQFQAMQAELAAHKTRDEQQREAERMRVSEEAKRAFEAFQQYNRNYTDGTTVASTFHRHMDTDPQAALEYIKPMQEVVMRASKMQQEAERTNRVRSDALRARQSEDASYYSEMLASVNALTETADRYQTSIATSTARDFDANSTKRRLIAQPPPPPQRRIEQQQPAEMGVSRASLTGHQQQHDEAAQQQMTTTTEQPSSSANPQHAFKELYKLQHRMPTYHEVAMGVAYETSGETRASADGTRMEPVQHAVRAHDEPQMFGVKEFAPRLYSEMERVWQASLQSSHLVGVLEPDQSV